MATGATVARTTVTDLKVASVWGVPAGLATVALLPYLMQLMPEEMARVPVSLPVLAAAQGLQATVVMGLLAFLGLRMGHRVGLGSAVVTRTLLLNGVAGVAFGKRGIEMAMLPYFSADIVLHVLAPLARGDAP